MHSPPLTSSSALLSALVSPLARGQIAAPSLTSSVTTAVRRESAVPEALLEIEEVPPRSPGKPLLTLHWLELGLMPIGYPIFDKGDESPIRPVSHRLGTEQGSGFP